MRILCWSSETSTIIYSVDFAHNNGNYPIGFSALARIYCLAFKAKMNPICFDGKGMATSICIQMILALVLAVIMAALLFISRTTSPKVPVQP